MRSFTCVSWYTLTERIRAVLFIRFRSSSEYAALQTKSEIKNCIEFDVTNDHLKKFGFKIEMENQKDLEIENDIATD